MLRDVITTIQKLVNNGTLALESNSIGTMTVSNDALSDTLTKPLEKITDLSIKVYCEKSGLSKDEIKELLDNETWLTSDECLTMGFATELIKDKEEAISQSVKKSLIEIVSQKCKKDKKKHQEVDEDKIIDCPFCDYEGKMPINDDGYFVCPECGRVIKDDQDVIDDDNDDEDETINDGVNESSTQVINESVNHNKELNVVSSFLNIFK